MSPVIALVGRPNVGKSSLFNRLLRRSQALVDDRPGVTRDRHYAPLVIDDRQGLLIDTGGFEPSLGDPLAGPVAAQVLAAVAESDLILLVVDGLFGPHPRDAELAQILRRAGRQVAVVVNKIDGPGRAPAALEFHGLGLEPVLAVSAAHGYGLDGLRRLVSESLEPAPEEPEEGAAPRVAVIGRPNAGKSSLINRLCREDRLVVHERPGTTRDAIDVDVRRGERRYTLVDTAGVRRRGRVDEKLEKLSVMRAIKGVEGSDVAVLVVDALEGLADQDAHVAGYAHERGRPLIIVINKWDAVSDRLGARRELKRQMELKMVFIDQAPVLTVSALTGSGVDRILPLVDKIMAQYVFRAQTSEVNQALERAVAAHVPPQAGRTRLKFYYATQAATRPPTFVVFANKPDSVHFSYKRFLVNQFKAAFGLDLVPVKLRVRDRHLQPRAIGGRAAKSGRGAGSKTGARAKTGTKPRPKAKPGSKKAIKPKAVVKPKAVAKPQAAVKPKAGAKPQAAAKPQAGVKPQVATEPRAAAKPQAAAKPKAAPKAQTVVKPKAAPKAQAVAQPEAATRPKAAPKPKADPKPKAAAKPTANQKTPRKKAETES